MKQFKVNQRAEVTGLKMKTAELLTMPANTQIVEAMKITAPACANMLWSIAHCSENQVAERLVCC